MTFPSGPFITRFAPSPTGVLHLGNARTAVLNFLLARQSGGKFLLRLEDTDQERSSFAAEAAILSSLAWLGLTPDEPVQHQSLRRAFYTKAVDTLIRNDQAYPCFCTEAELEHERESATQNGLPPRYSGRCARLSQAERDRRVSAGEAHSIRFRNNALDDISFADLLKGAMSIPASAFGDFVLLRTSGWPSYNLAVVVDDADMGVTLVLRGEDHLTNTARQILLYAALNLTPPAFAHHGLLVDPAGKKLSKRTGAFSIPDCQNMGLEPLAVVQYLAALSGALPLKTAYAHLEDMLPAFNPRALGRGNAVMNTEELKGVSARVLRQADTRITLQRLNASLPKSDPWLNVDADTQKTLIASLRDNVATLSELQAMLPCFTCDTVSFTTSVLAELKEALSVLMALREALETKDDVRLTDDELRAALRQTSTQSGAKGKNLYHPIRLALTGTSAGPELTTVLTFLTPSRIRLRINAVLDIFSHCQH